MLTPSYQTKPGLPVNILKAPNASQLVAPSTSNIKHEDAFLYFGADKNSSHKKMSRYTAAMLGALLFSFSSLTYGFVHHLNNTGKQDYQARTFLENFHDPLITNLQLALKNPDSSEQEVGNALKEVCLKSDYSVLDVCQRLTTAFGIPDDKALQLSLKGQNLQIDNDAQITGWLESVINDSSLSQADKHVLIATTSDFLTKTTEARQELANGDNSDIYSKNNKKATIALLLSMFILLGVFTELILRDP